MSSQIVYLEPGQGPSECVLFLFCLKNFCKVFVSKNFSHGGGRVGASACYPSISLFVLYVARAPGAAAASEREREMRVRV